MRRILLGMMVMLALTMTPAAFFGGAALAACPGTNSAKGQVLEGVNETGSDCSEAGVTSVFGVAVEILSIVAGALGVIMVIVAGIRYTTAGGDSGRVAAAKSTLIYALLGLVVAVLAQLLVHIVISQSANAQLPVCPADKSVVPPACKN